MRATIGAALQEAALDNFLTGREHMDLQGGLHGLARPERAERGAELLERVGLTEAADRKVGGYSGGMKRRLDLALALDPPALDPLPRRADHRPRHPEPQRAVGGGRAGSPSEDGVTVFLTTQYLEEADVLADRVGIIDHGQIVAEGTPGRAEGPRSGGRPSRPCPPIPTSARRWPRCSSASASPPAPPRRASPCVCAGAPRTSPRSCARSTREGVRVANIQVHAPTLDDVFLAKTGRSLEGAGEEEDPEQEPVPA